MQSWTKTAHLISTKHLRGELVARLVTGSFSLLRKGVEVALVPPVLDAPRRCVVESVQDLGSDRVLVKFAEISDLETAKAVVGCYCLCPSQEHDAPSSVSLGMNWGGFGVIDSTHGFIGQVKAVEKRPFQNLLTIERVRAGEQGNDLLVPVVDAFVVDVDVDARLIYVDHIEGLLEL